MWQSWKNASKQTKVLLIGGVTLVALAGLGVGIYFAVGNGSSKTSKQAEEGSQPIAVKSASTTAKAAPYSSGGPISPGFLVFVRDHKLVRSNSDGTNQVVITGGYDDTPAISADNKKIAFVHYDSNPQGNNSSAVPDPTGSLYIANVDGSNPTRVTSAEWGTSSGWTPVPSYVQQPNTVWMRRRCSQPSFSPDGAKLVFIVDDDSWSESPNDGSGGYGIESLAVIGISGSQKGQLQVLASESAEGGAGFGRPKFSNDGAYIYFDDIVGGGPPGGASLVRVNASDGSNKVVIAHGGTNLGYWAFDFSPTDGNVLAGIEVTANSGGFVDKIFLMNVDGSSKRYLGIGNVNTDWHSLYYSPDGAFLVFAAQGKIHNNVYVVKTTAKCLERLPTTAPVPFGVSNQWGNDSYESVLMKKALAICLIAIVGAGTVVGIWALVDFAGKAQVPSVIAGR